VRNRECLTIDKQQVVRKVAALGKRVLASVDGD